MTSKQVKNTHLMYEIKVHTIDTDIFYKKKVIGLCEREKKFP